MPSPYTPNPVNALQPADTDLAYMAAPELRALKAAINTRTASVDQTILTLQQSTAVPQQRFLLSNRGLVIGQEARTYRWAQNTQNEDMRASTIQEGMQNGKPNPFYQVGAFTVKGIGFWASGGGVPGNSVGIINQDPYVEVKVGVNDHASRSSFTKRVEIDSAFQANVGTNNQAMNGDAPIAGFLDLTHPNEGMITIDAYSPWGAWLNLTNQPFGGFCKLNAVHNFHLYFIGDIT